MSEKLIDLMGFSTVPAISTGNLVKDNIANAKLYEKLLNENKELYPVFVHKDYDLDYLWLTLGWGKEGEPKEAYEDTVKWVIKKVEFCCFDVWLGRILYNYSLDCYKDPNDVHGYFNKLIPPASAEYLQIFENAKELKDCGLFHEDEVEAKHADMWIRFDDYIIALLPINNPWEALAWFPMGRFNNCPAPEYQIALARELYESFGARVMLIGKDRLTYYLDKPLYSREEICKASRTLIIADGDIFPNYMDAVNQTIGRHTWQLWWD